ncbi:hypothetical protein BC940DRAFT_276638 [Gongronella butleri]|nr:hypothetical protein BC940DRAFT_276638 [Gongronella butleri]
MLCTLKAEKQPTFNVENLICQSTGNIGESSQAVICVQQARRDGAPTESPPGTQQEVNEEHDEPDITQQQQPKTPLPQQISIVLQQNKFALPPLAQQSLHKMAFAAGLRRINNSLSAADTAILAEVASKYEPSTPAQWLDLMAARLVIQGLDTDEHIAAMKLAASHIVDTVNPKVFSIFKHHLPQDLCLAITNHHDLAMKRLADGTRAIYSRTLDDARDEHGEIVKEKLGPSICKQKLALYQQGVTDDAEAHQVLNILNFVYLGCMADWADQVDFQASELTHYRRVASVLDFMLHNKPLKLIDGEHVCKVTREISKANSSIYKENGVSITFGRRVDLLVTCQGIELTSNEWKRNVSSKIIAQQQCKNARLNKAILKSILARVPLSNIEILAMDWAGSSGYLFSLRNHDDLYVVRHHANLSIPDYVGELQDFIDTIEHLFGWVQHNLRVKDTVLAARFLTRKRGIMHDVVPSTLTTNTDESWHHDTFFSPRKRRSSMKRDDEQADDSESDLEAQAAALIMNSPSRSH